MSRVYAEVIGDPIAHSKSPLIHNFWLERLKVDAEYRKCHVRPIELADYFTNRRRDADWRGCNVTIPHKESAALLVDHLWPGTIEIGAINTVIKHKGRLFGANTDIGGIIEPLNNILTAIFGGDPPPQQTVAIIGAGGAARAAAAAINSRFPDWPIRFLARRREQAAAITHSLKFKADAEPIEDAALTGVTLLINASPLGMVEKLPLNLRLDAMADTAMPKIIFDMVYAPLETQLLTAARRKGFATIDGLSMLIAQAAEAFELIFGEVAPSACDDQLRALLIK
jgi:shikimate dehydrogenase